MNSHNFYTYVLKYIFFEFIIKSQKLQAIVLAWENLQWGFCNVGCHLYFVAVLHLSFFFIHIFFSTSSLTLPWTLARFLHPFCTFSPAHRRVIRDTFIFNHSVIFLPRALRFWAGIFYPQAFFTLRSFPTFLAKPAFIKASLGAGSYSLKFAGLHTDPRNTGSAHLFVWFTVIHNLLHSLNLYLHVNIAKVLLVVKTLKKKNR